MDEAAVLILWVMAKGAVCITSSGDAGRIQKMANTEKLRDLTKEEVTRIDEAGRKVHFRHWVSKTAVHLIAFADEAAGRAHDERIP